MIDILQTLVGKRISKFLSMSDYENLHLSDGTIVNIYNIYKTHGEDDVGFLVGTVILDAIASKTKVAIHFSSGTVIEIDITQHGYKEGSPEAVEIIGSDGTIYVWNY